MSLAVADKLLRAFEALKNFKDGANVSDPSAVPLPVKKKDVVLSKKDRIAHLNVIGDLTCSPLLRNLTEFGKLIAVSIETLLSFCDDEEPDVRLVAGDCINRITKGFMDNNVARIPVELYKEIKKNGSPRCLRAALSKFADICYLIRPHKCRPFITNLLPCIARICTRTEDSVQETLAITMKKILPVLGAFMNDKETKILLKTFLQNFNSSSATTRRTTASSLTMICRHARKPSFFFSWIINILLESIASCSLEQNQSTYSGALLCLRHIVPHLDDEEADEVVMRGSFGVTHQQKEQPNDEVYEKEEKQLLRMYKLIMYSTQHTNHNVVTAALETLQQLLQSPPRKVLSRLLANKGLTPIATQDGSGSVLATEFQDLDNLSFTSSRDSGVDEPLAEISIDGSTEKVQEGGMSVDDIREMRRNFSQPDEQDSEALNDTASEVSENSSEGFGSIGGDNGSVLGHRRYDSDTSGINTRTSSLDDLDVDEQEPQEFTEDSLEPQDHAGHGVDDGYTIDPVQCLCVPMLHCTRVMCSFLLSGRSNEVLSDRKVRISVKSLALGCLATIFKIYPEGFFARVMPEGDDEERESDLGQLIRDVLLYGRHHDPQVRGSLAILLGNLLESSLKLARFDFASWSAEICENFKTAELTVADMLNILEKLILDESSVTVRSACLGLRQCLPALWHSTYSSLTIQLCIKIVHLKTNSYWLVKVGLLQIVSDFNFSLIGFLEKQEKQISSGQATNNSFNLQQTFFYHVVLELLADDDLRVRSEAARTIVKLLPNLFFETDFPRRQPLLSVAKKTLGKTLDLSTSRLCTNAEVAIIKDNLARVIMTLSHRLNAAISKSAVLGCCEALSMLSNTYPVSSYPSSWGCDVIAITASPPPTGKTSFTGLAVGATSSPSSATPPASAFLCNNGGGSLSFVVELMTSSWLTLNLRAHDDALLLVGNLLIGVANSAISHSVDPSDVNSSGTNSEATGKWMVFCDSSISALADKVFVHILRILNICFHIIDNVTPGAHSAKVSLLSKDKDKSSAPIPGAAVPTSSSPQVPTSVASPKKLLNRSRKNTDVDSPSASGEKASSVKGHSETDGKLTGGTTGSPVGQFHQLPHYYKLYEVVKGAFSNYKVNLKFQDDDKFVKLLKSTLTVFAKLLELAFFSDVGKHVDEIIRYLQATVKCEAGSSFLCVQQMLRSIFGVNVACQPEQSSSNFPSEKQGLVTEVLLPTFLEGSAKGIHDAGFYQSYFEEFQNELSEMLEEIRKRELVKESTSFKNFGFIKKLRQRSGSFRPPLKVDKQVHIHSYIRMFEPLVIQALKEYTSTSSIQIQAQVLSILVQLIRLRVNYALLDSEQAFLNFVLKQFEFIKAGQLRDTELFSPHMFQFLILLSYECFQPKFNQAKSVFGMSRIIQVCDDLMACGQSARTHAIPALRPIVYDLFDLQATGRNENTKELDTQREVFISMLLRLAQFPEILKLIVYVLGFYRQNDDKWKKFSRQSVDITLQMLIKQQVIIDDLKDLKCLEELFDSVAPIALRPLDMILKAVFSPANLSGSSRVKRWLSGILVLLKVIITQNTEENILSRITQLEFKGALIGNIVDSEELEDADLASECSPNKILVYFLIHTLYLATRNASRTHTEQRLGKGDDFVPQLTSRLLLYLQDIVKSGLFKSVSNTALTTIKDGLLTQDSARSSDVKINKINELMVSLKETQPVMYLQWLQLLFTLGFDDEEWWTTLLGKLKGKNGECTPLSVNGHISVKGTFLIYCKILGGQIKHVEDTSKFKIFLQENLTDLVHMSNEPPVKALLRQIYSNSLCSQVFIVVVRNQTSEGCIKNMKKPDFRKDLLVILDDLHYKQSNSLIQLLIKEFLSSHYRALTRKCETMICSRLEYCISLPKEELGTFFSPEDIRGIHDSLISLGVTKRNPRLASLITHMSSDSIDTPAVESSLDLESALKEVKTKELNEMNWYYVFVHNCCCSLKINEFGIKHLEEVVHLLHVLNFEQITKIMDDEKFNTALLKPCLAFGIKKTIGHYYRKFDHESPGNPFEDSTYFNTYGVDHLFQCSYSLLLRHVQEIVFNVTTFDDVKSEVKRTADTNKTEAESSLISSSMNHAEVQRLSQKSEWKQNVLEITQAFDVYLAQVDQLPTEARLPKEIHCAVCQFGMIALEVLCEENRRCNLCCTSKLTVVLRCFSRMLHSRHLYLVFNSVEYSNWISHSLRSIYHLFKTVFLHPGNQLPDNIPDDLQHDPYTTLKQASALVHYLYTLLNQRNSSHHSSVPSTLTQTFRDVISGLARLSLFNSYVRIPPLAWKMGWGDHEHDKELPPLPIDILREKDVLQDFVLRVNSIGWISRQQFEETWAALLGVLSSPLLPDQSSREEDIESIKSGCLALQCITALLLQTTLYPLPGNPAVGTNLHTSRHKELPFLDSRAGKKLRSVRKIVEDHFLLQCRQSSPLQTAIDADNLYGGNIETVYGLHSYSLGQISINSLQAQCAAPPNDTADFSDADADSTSPSPQSSTHEKIDVRSCVQFLMELFERWVSPYTQPKTPLMLLTESVKSLLIISDLFLDQTQHECMLSELLDLYQNYPAEDEIMMQYLLPALCKALAVLKLEGVIPEKIVKIMDTSFKAPHVPLQVSCLYGALYLLESRTSSVVALVIPLVTDYVQKVLALITDTSVFGEHRLLVLLSTSFYMLEHYESEIADVEFKNNFLKAVINMASAKDESAPLSIYHAIIRGLERLVVSFSLSREDSDALVKLSVERLAMRNPQRAITALGLLLTCMYTGKEGDRPSGLSPASDAVDTPTDDTLLVALERVTSLFDRIRKGFRSEAKLVSEVLPIVLGDFFPPQDVMNKVIGEFVSSQQPHPELMATVLYKVCENLISQGQQESVKDWVLLSLRSFTQRPPLGMAVWSFTCVFIASSSNRWIRALFSHVVSRIGKLENIDRHYFLITASDFYFNQIKNPALIWYLTIRLRAQDFYENLTEEERQSFKSTFENVAQSGTPYADLVNIV